MLARSLMIRAVVARNPSMITLWSVPGKMSASMSRAVRASAW